MYIKDIKIINKGPIKNVNYTFPFKEDLPIPVVLTGVNGSGKTLLLINLISSYINLKGTVFEEIPETERFKYYKVQTYSYTRELFTYFNINFDKGYYCDFSTRDAEAFKENYNGDLENINIKQEKYYDGFLHKNSEFEKSDFDDVFLYFPVDRYYEPAWLNKSNAKLSKNANKDNYVGVNYDNSIVYNILNELEKWIIDLTLDSYLFEIKERTTHQSNGQTIISNVLYGPNTDIIKNINLLLTKIYQGKDPNIESAEIYVLPKENRHVSIRVKHKDKEELEIVANTFGHLSSGEIMVFGMFANIIKSAKDVSSLKNIKGVVLIDEVDESLHIDFCKRVMPAVLSLFPKIQFIITTHSPFFLLGMKEKFDSDFEMINLPEMIKNDIYDFGEIQKVYDIVGKDYSEILVKNEEIKKKIQSYEKPVIITEGKTDIKHLKASLEYFKDSEKFSKINVLFNDSISNGCDSVERFAQSLAETGISVSKIIFIFDCDTELKRLKLEPGEYKNIGGNVYGYSIPNPNNVSGGISIEQLYSSDDLKLMDDNGRRMFFNSEFDKQGRLLEKKSTICENKNSINDFYKNQKIRVIDSGVISEDGKNIALTKNDFAEYVVNKTGKFKNVDFSNFEAIWKAIERIINE